MIPVYEGYVFKGWAESANADTGSYAAGSTVALTYPDHASITLYAVWEAVYGNSYDVEFDANGGMGAPEAMRGLAYGSSHKLPDSRPVRDGYDFKGWAYSADAGKAEFYLTRDLMLDEFVSTSHWFMHLNKPDTLPTRPVTLYAVWAKHYMGVKYSDGEIKESGTHKYYQDLCVTVTNESGGDLYVPRITEIVEPEYSGWDMAYSNIKVEYIKNHRQSDQNIAAMNTTRVADADNPNAYIYRLGSRNYVLPDGDAIRISCRITLTASSEIGRAHV